MKIFAATLSIDCQIKNKTKRELKYVIIKTEEKLDDEDKTNIEKSTVFKQIIEDLNFYNDNVPIDKGIERLKVIQQDGDGSSQSKSDDLSPLLRELNLKASLLRKELKIKGQIREAHQRNKLSYVSLMHQISEAESQGYDEQEIVNSVIRSMVLSLTLRNVLETTPNLTLQRLLQFLEAHFDEKNATDLY